MERLQKGVSLRRFGRGKQFVGVRLDLSKRMDGAGKVERVRKSPPVLVRDQQSRLLQDFKVVHHRRTAQRQDVHEGFQLDGFAVSHPPVLKKLQRWQSIPEAVR